MYISFLLALARTFVFHPSHCNPEHQVALNLRPKAWQVLTQCWLHDCGLEWECVYGSVCAIALILPPLAEPHRGSTEIHF